MDFDEQSEAEVKHCQISEPGGKVPGTRMFIHCLFYVVLNFNVCWCEPTLESLSSLLGELFKGFWRDVDQVVGKFWLENTVMMWKKTANTKRKQHMKGRQNKCAVKSQVNPPNIQCLSASTKGHLSSFKGLLTFLNTTAFCSLLPPLLLFLLPLDDKSWGVQWAAHKVPVWSFWQLWPVF